MMNNIGFVISGLGGGGAERVALNLGEFFASKQMRVFFYLTSDYAFDSYRGVEKMVVRKLDAAASKNPFAKIRQLCDLFVADQISIVIGFLPMPGFYAAQAAKKVKLPCIISERNSPRDDPRNPLIRALKKKSFYMSDSVVFQTTEARDFFNSRIRSKACIIPNPIGSSFQFVDRQRNLIDPNRFVMVGRISPQKNYELALRAFQQIHKKRPLCTLEIYGRGDEGYKRKLIEQYLDNESKKSVFFHGFSEDVPSIYSKAGVFLMTSHYEGMPNSLLEAVASGVPSISTDCRPGGAKAILSDFGGSLLVRNGDLGGLVSAMDRVLEEYDTFFDSAQKSGETVRQLYSLENVGESWIKLILSVISA